MRLLTYGEDGQLLFTPDLVGRDPVPPYAILSHTWGEGEVTYHDIANGSGASEAGYAKIQFCAERAKADNLDYFWVDTCCIDKTSSAELSASIRSMFKWYRNAARCYVYLSDVSSTGVAPDDAAFKRSRWFTRGWTLQELLAPSSIHFYTKDSLLLGDKAALAQDIAEVTGIPIAAIQGEPLGDFDYEERIRWANGRQTKLEEDEAYSLFGILDVQLPILYGEERAKAFRRLRKEIRDNQAEHDGVKLSSNVHWLVPKIINSLFTGRSDLVNRIQNALCPHGSTHSTRQKRFVITGMGGQGKSEVAIQVASMMREDFWGVFWVDLSNQSTAQSGFLAVAKALGSSAETYEDSLQVLACATQRWLLILDNADEPHFDYATYFPSGNRGSIIMTSRNPMCRQYSTIGAVALEGLDITHSTQLLLKAAQISEVSWPSHTVISHNIIKLLGSHTLALIQAGAYISAGYCRLDQYAERFQQHRRQLLEHYPDQQRSRYSDVYATFEASADALKRSQGESALDALSLLGILSMLHSSVLPLQLFQDAWAGAKLVLQREPTTFDVIRLQQAPRRSRRFQLPWVSSKQKPVHEALSDQDIDRLQEEHVSRLPEFLGVQLQHWSDHRLKRARALLVSLSLVTMHQTNEDDGLSMHPLVHAWARDRQDVKHQQHAWISTACTIAFSRGISNLWRSNKELLRPHLQVLIPPVPLVLFSYETPQLMLPILLHCGWILNVTWEQKILQQLLNSVYQALNITPENVIEEYMPIWRLAASVAVSLSRTVLAIFLLERITTWDQIALAEADPIRLASQYNLGRAYNINGQPEKAISILENTAINYKKIDTHRDWLLSTLYELNGAYNATGRSQKAVTLLKEVIEEQGSAPGNERTHDKLRSQHALATAYIAAGQATTAVTLLEHVIEMYERLVDEMHPDRLNAQHELARAYKFDGKSEKSVHLLKHIISVQKQSVDKTDYLLLASQYSLGTQYLTAKETSEAVILLEHVVKMYDFVLEETQSERLNAKYALALAYVDARELDKALMLMRHVVQVRKTTLESVHPHRVASERLLSDLENETVYD